MEATTKATTGSVASNLYLLYVTTEKADGTTTSTWMANSPDGGGYSCHNTPSTKFLRYWTKEQVSEIKKSFDKLEKLSPWGGSNTKTTFKVMSLKAAVNHTIKRMKELMDTRKLANVSDVRVTKSRIDSHIRSVEKGEPEELPVSFLGKYKL